jgi:hypothetical protein
VVGGAIGLAESIKILEAEYLGSRAQMPTQEIVTEGGEQFIVTTWTKEEAFEIPEFSIVQNIKREEHEIDNSEWRKFPSKPTDEECMAIFKSLGLRLPGEPRPPKLPEKTRHDRINFTPTKATRKK